MPPIAILCHASEDKVFAKRLATSLIDNGVDTFFDEWEIRSGDSLREKIDAGLGNCTHFIALLTPKRISKPWVNAEMDAAFVRKVTGLCKFIPLRMGLPAEKLPPLLQALHSPMIADEDYEVSLRMLLADMFGVSSKPPLRDPPEFVRRPTDSPHGLSTAAAQLARAICTRSSTGMGAHSQMESNEVRNIVELPEDDIVDGISELEDLRLVVRYKALGKDPLGFRSLEVRDRFFSVLDGHFMPWIPEQDATRLAAYMLNSTDSGFDTRQLGKAMGWEPRRLNPALTLLLMKGAVGGSKSTGSQPYVTFSIFKTEKTRRFLKRHG